MPKIVIGLKGSSTSGNFAHKGRPGKIGGSVPVNASAGAIPYTGKLYNASKPGNELRQTDFVPGQGAAQLDAIMPDEDLHLDGPNVKWTVGQNISDYQLANGQVPGYRAIYPDELHTSRDALWPQSYKLGGGFINTSPPNPKEMQPGVFKFWATSGTAQGAEKGSNPHCSYIREAADKHLGIAGDPPPSIALYKQSDSLYNGIAQNMVNSIAAAAPEQPALWRGVGTKYGNQLRAASVGDKVIFSLASTSRDATVAHGYAGSSDVHGNTIMRIQPGARGLAVNNYYKHDQEVITGGVFEVLGQSTARDGTIVVDLRQIEVHTWQ